MRENIRVNGFDFEWTSDGNGYSNEGYYSCRGEVMYDDEHDEMCEPALWDAAEKLETELIKEGYEAEANYSEKGWVDINVNKQ